MLKNTKVPLLVITTLEMLSINDYKKNENERPHKRIKMRDEKLGNIDLEF